MCLFRKLLRIFFYRRAWFRDAIGIPANLSTRDLNPTVFNPGPGPNPRQAELGRDPVNSHGDAENKAQGEILSGVSLRHLKFIYFYDNVQHRFNQGSAMDFLGSNYPSKKFSSRNSNFSVFDTLC